MRETGSEINDLAEHFGIHRSTVIAHLNRQGVEGRRRQGRALSDERLHQAGEFYVAGHSLIETGDRFDVDRRYLRKALPAAGFELRRPGRQAASS
jgi:transposase